MEFKIFFIVCICAAAVQGSDQDGFSCSTIENVSSDYSSPVCYDKTCIDSIEKQIATELDAAFHYMYLAAYFDQVSENRPGMAKFLYEAASEERHHGMMMIDYLSMRGSPIEEKFNFTKVTVPDPITYKGALETALNMEIKVTYDIHNIVEKCATDFHGADVFTNPILDEQHRGVHHIQSLLKEFNDFARGSNEESQLALAEFMFDKKLA